MKVRFFDYFLPVAIVAALVIVLFMLPMALAHDHNRPELDGWFKGLTSRNKVACCDGTDAMRLDDIDWESRDGHYRVRLQGQWVDVPDEAVVDGPNRAGPTMVWPYYINGALIGVRCFMPGSMV